MSDDVKQEASLSLKRIWATWIAVSIMIIASAVVIYLHERNARIAEAEQRLLTETNYLNHVLSANLSLGEFVQIPALVEAWGRLNSDTVALRLTAENGFVFGEFERETPGKHTQSQVRQLPFSYENNATLLLEKSFDPIHTALTELAMVLFIAATLILLLSFLMIQQLYRYRNQTRLTQIEYERRLDMQQAMEKMATHDALTGLPNRQLLDDQIETRIAESRRFGRKLAVLFIDLDNFKQVNDTFGHAVGDELLRISSDRMLACLRSYDLLARFGGDEFVVLLANIEDSKEVDRVAIKLIDSIRPCIESIGHELYVSASIGISLFPDDCDNKVDLLRHADTAMYTAKEAGRNCYRYYTPALNKAVQHRQRIEKDLRRALANDELHLVYQPKLELRTGTVNSCEALLRWRTSDTEILPSEFLPIAERSVLLRDIEVMVIEQAVRQCAEWHTQGAHDLRIDINLSGRMLLNRETFRLLEHALQLNGVTHRKIGIELSEHALIKATDDMLGELDGLRQKGCVVSLDDFGTGYSSLGHFKQLPVDILTIDREFISGLPDSEQDGAITKAIVAMGQNLGKRILAEGVETAAQMQYVIQHGCDLAQGYLIAKPLEASDFIDWLSSYRERHRDGDNNFTPPILKTTNPTPN